MSIPREGSSSRMTRGRVASILPITTFCWLPPDSDPMGAPPPEVFTVTLRMLSSTNRRSARLLVNSPRVKLRIEASDRFWPTLMVWTSPSRCRSSGTRARPRAMRSAMERWDISCPSSTIWPPLARSRPAQASSSSVRPAPISP